MGLQCAAAMSAGASSCFLTNPLDLVRTRVQVQRRSIPDTARSLWATERLGIFTKGLTARMTSSVLYSIAIIFGYETVKRWSVYDEYKERIKW
jgi:solute carrier family 25 protein 44